MDIIKFQNQTITGNVNKESGTISGVSLISNVYGEAKGHGVKIDEASIESFYNQTKDKKIRAYYTHDDSNDALDAVGWFENIRIEKEDDVVSLRGDFVALESFRNHQEHLFDSLMQLASESPSLVHLSAEFHADYIGYDAEGKEYEITNFSEEEEIFIRCRECHAFSFVSNGATNDSLYSKEANGKVEFDYEEVLEATIESYEQEIGELKLQLETAIELAKETQKEKLKLEKLYTETKEKFDSYKEDGEEPLDVNYTSEVTLIDELQTINDPRERSKFVLRNMQELWTLSGAVDEKPSINNKL
jgi:hypothetical protein